MTEKAKKFFPDVKGNISPSQVALFFSDRATYIKRYFAGEKTFVSKQMEKGTKAHALVEGGFSNLGNDYDLVEHTLEVQIRDDGLIYKCIFDRLKSKIEGDTERTFADVKTGKEWSQSQAYHDLKQRGYAYALFMQDETIQRVVGAIEHIQVDDDGMQVEGTEATVFTVSYERDSTLEFYGNVLDCFFEEVEAEYAKYGVTSEIDMSAVVDQDELSKWRELTTESKAVEKARKDLGAKIAKEMVQFGGKSFKTEDGKTVYLSPKTSYEYPEEDMQVCLDSGAVVSYKDALQMIAELQNSVKCAEAEYKAFAKPTEITYSLMIK